MAGVPDDWAARGAVLHQGDVAHCQGGRGGVDAAGHGLPVGPRTPAGAGSLRGSGGDVCGLDGIVDLHAGPEPQ